jgi:hypothetical protein
MLNLQNRRGFSDTRQVKQMRSGLEKRAVGMLLYQLLYYKTLFRWNG